MSGTQFNTTCDSNDDGQSATSIEGTGHFTKLGKAPGAAGQFDCDNPGLPLFNPEFEIVGYTWGASATVS